MSLKYRPLFPLVICLTTIYMILAYMYKGQSLNVHLILCILLTQEGDGK